MKKTVFVTGATGTMGMETLRHLMENLDVFNIRALARDSEANHKKLAEFGDSIEVLWGDLNDDAVLRQGVTGADYVLHIGAFVSPMCDAYPVETLRTNYGSTLSLLKSIKELGQADTTHFVYIGSVSMTGDRQPPIHWGRIGDPMKPAIYDYYALSKVFSERAVIQSGLRYWASVRQTGMLPTNPEAGKYPIGSHANPNNVLEHSSAVDSGNLMRNICLKAPEEFWRRCWNLSSGREYRDSSAWSRVRGGGDIRFASEPWWYALYNFHGHYYLDADELEATVPFRCQTYAETQEYTRKFKEALAPKPAPDAPKPPPITEEMLRGYYQMIFSMPGGTIQFVRDNDEERIKVFYGSREKLEAIPKTWDLYDLHMPLELPSKPLSRGFDESKPIAELSIEDMKQAAEFRGGKCLSDTMTPGDLYTDLKWCCAQGHEFYANPYAVLFAGHWCEDCLSTSWRYGAMAEENPFFAQVWTPLHKGEENYEVMMVTDPRDVAKLYK